MTVPLSTSCLSPRGCCSTADWRPGRGCWRGHGGCLPRPVSPYVSPVAAMLPLAARCAHCVSACDCELDTGLSPIQSVKQLFGVVGVRSVYASAQPRADANAAHTMGAGCFATPQPAAAMAGGLFGFTECTVVRARRMLLAAGWLQRSPRRRCAVASRRIAGGDTQPYGYVERRDRWLRGRCHGWLAPEESGLHRLRLLGVWRRCRAHRRVRGLCAVASAVVPCDHECVPRRD